MTGLIVDLFGGCGGWAEGLRSLGLAEVGIEIDTWACASRAAAGHRTIRAEVSAYPTSPFAGAWGLIFSPPCGDWSQAGKGAGRAGLTGHLVDQVPRWVGDLRPEWVACEQVPGVLPVWREFALQLEGWDYSTWCGILCAADFGVPQTRERAILIASRTRAVTPPAATHAERPHPVMFGDELQPWVTMAEALGWGIDSPSRTLAGNRQPRWLYDDPDGTHGHVILRTGANSMRHSRDVAEIVPYERPVNRPAPVVDTKAGSAWSFRRPATTVCGDPRIGRPGHKDRAGGESQFAEDSIRLSLADALVLQGFDPGYPVQGNKTEQFRQVGNAIPPPLAAHIVAAAAGIDALEATA